MTTQSRNSWWGLTNSEIGSKLAEATLNKHRNAERSIAGRKKKIAIGLAVSFAFWVLFSLPLAAQNADLAGTVRDTTGSVVPGAALKLTNVGTGVTRAAPTDGMGLYAFPNVQPGVYDLSVSAAGFESQKKTGITINVADNAQINFDLKVGAVSASVTVTAEEQLLGTADATTGQIIDREYVNDMPLISRQALDLAYLTPGVSQPPSSSYGFSANTSVPYLTANNFVSDGSRNAQSDILVDGITTVQEVTSGNSLDDAYTPSVEAIQEFKVQQTNFSAEYGFSGATITNLITRSGTNKFHGDLYDFLRNNKLDANNYFANQNHVRLPGLHENIYGGTIDGPIFKNKTFFFFDYEGTRSSSLASSFVGVPSAAEQKGDFSELCGGDGPHGPAPGATFVSGRCSTPAGQLWDPYVATYSPSQGPVRTNIIPNNRIDQYASPGNSKLAGTVYQLSGGAGDLIDPVASKLMKYYPAPNVNVGTTAYNPYLNYFSSTTDITNNDQFDIKIDQHFSDQDVLSARYSHRLTFLESPACFANDAADPCAGLPEDSTAHLFSLSYDHIFSGTTMLNLSYGLTRTARYPKPITTLNPVTLLGMPSYITESNTLQLPAVGIDDGSYGTVAGNSISIGTGAWAYLKDGQDTHDLLATLSRINGRHELKFGGEFRFHQFNDNQPGTPAGLFQMAGNGTSETGVSGGGDAMASMLIGTTVNSWGQYNIPAALATQNFAWGGFAQDNFHVSPKLTVNIGLRYDLTLPATERHNEMNSVLPNVTSPLQAPAGSPALMGGLGFASSGHRSVYNADYTNFQPRFGIAYSLNDKTVIRTGYGIYYDPSEVSADADVADVQGFSQNTNWQNSDYDGATPWGMLRNPFPPSGSLSTSILKPTGSSRGLLTNVGGEALGPVPTMNATPYEQSWSFGVQRSLHRNMMVEANYIGKKGTHLLFGVGGDYNLSHLGPTVSALEASGNVAAIQAEGASLSTYVPNPYASAIAAVNPTSSLASSTVPAYQLQLPHPQFTSFLVLNGPWANSSYNAVQLSVQKRLSNGLQFLASYVFSKAIDDASIGGNGSSFLGGSSSGVLDPNNLKLERAVSAFNVPQVFQLSYVYELPFGRGQHFGATVNPIVNGFIGGWQTTGIWRFDDGQPLILGLAYSTAMPTFGQRPEITGTPARNHGSNWKTNYFTTGATFALPPNYTLGNAPRNLSVNAPGTANASLSAFKQFSLSSFREGSYLEYRLETFNALNHPQFGPPNTTVGSGSFGLVSSQANSPRQVQMALKLYF